MILIKSGEMMSLHSINAQIRSVQNSIYHLNGQLEAKKEELRRLRQAQSDLSECKNDFQKNERLCTQPNLTPKTWNGYLADNYDSFRERDLLASYKDIYHSQLASVLSDISSKMGEINGTIEELKTSIQSCEQRLSSLYEARSRALEDDD